MREIVKAVTGGLVGAASSQCRYDRTVFLLAHMRCGSTALSNILCSRSEISGYGEAHIAYRGTSDLGRLVVNQALRRAWKPRARWLFDKLLHSRHDAAAPPAFFGARAIFLCRRPEPSIASIRRLYSQLGKDEYRSDDEAADYYVERLARLSELWHRFPADHRVGMTHDMLVTDTGTCLSAISKLLNLSAPLENRYRSHRASSRGGGGDPTTSAGRQRIDRQGSGTDACELEIDPERLARAQSAYRRFVAMIGVEGPA